MTIASSPSTSRTTTRLICSSVSEPASLTTGTTSPFSPSAVPTPISMVGEMAIRSSSQRPLIAGATAIASAAAFTM
jgi:hypothetical protein